MGSQSKIAKFRQIRKINRDHAHVYRSAVDRAKTFVLRYATTHKQVATALGWLKTISLRVAGVPTKVVVRVSGSDFLVAREIFELGEYEAAKKWTLPKDARVFDLGGNIGLASVFFATLAPQGRFLVVEPDEDNCRMIERNCRELGDRLQIIKGFVAAKDGVAGLDRSWRAWAFHKVDTIDDQHEAVTCYSMQSLLNKSGFDSIDVLKCDVEGSEKEIFTDCKQWISRVNYLIVEVHHPYKVHDLYDDLRAAGWDFDIAEERQDDTHGLAFLQHKPS
ncbi:MAG TPA: FkbM family methyltransferase [Tepidisphaeraceae bacterium]|nr:FkbM family methyltransferase [Tepidisphaeraceae bacterium]